MKLLPFLFLYALLIPTPTQAYLDPGTGSYITQLVAGMLIGGLYFVKLYWQKISLGFKNIIKKLTGRETD